jgi:hypothetical protein
MPEKAVALTDLNSIAVPQRYCTKNFLLKQGREDRQNSVDDLFVFMPTY